MQNRRDFLKTAALAAFSSGLVARQALAGESLLSTIHINKLGLGGKMKMTFFPYELKLRHVFTVATYSRTTTPDVQVEIEYEGVTGYGEASMPPYLGETVESVMNFLGKVNLEQFSDPFQLDDILSYVDSLSPKDTAAKAAVDIALHDLVGKLLGAPWYKIWGLNKEKTPSTTWITQQSPLPIFADESLQRLGDVAALKGAFTGINIKLMKCTGMREAWKMVTLAHALGMRVMVGCMTETSCAISAASQFSPLVDFADLDGNLLISNDRFKGVEVVKGKITLNDLPGIGVMKI